MYHWQAFFIQICIHYNTYNNKRKKTEAHKTDNTKSQNKTQRQYTLSQHSGKCIAKNLFEIYLELFLNFKIVETV